MPVFILYAVLAILLLALFRLSCRARLIASHRAEVRAVEAAAEEERCGICAFGQCPQCHPDLPW